MGGPEAGVSAGRSPGGRARRPGYSRKRSGRRPSVRPGGRKGLSPASGPIQPCGRRWMSCARIWKWSAAWRRLAYAERLQRVGASTRNRRTTVAEAFAWYGLDVDNCDPQEVAERIRSRSIRMQMVAALDEWAFGRKEIKDERWRQLVAVARAADSDPWAQTGRATPWRGETPRLWKNWPLPPRARSCRPQRLCSCSGSHVAPPPGSERWKSSDRFNSGIPMIFGSTKKSACVLSSGSGIRPWRRCSASLELPDKTLADSCRRY